MTLTKGRGSLAAKGWSSLTAESATKPWLRGCTKSTLPAKGRRLSGLRRRLLPKRECAAKAAGASLGCAAKLEARGRRRGGASTAAAILNHLCNCATQPTPDSGLCKSGVVQRTCSPSIPRTGTPQHNSVHDQTKRP